MTVDKTNDGIVHTLPADLRQILRAVPALLAMWEDITPLARNEWICWVTSAKKLPTRQRRMDLLVSKLLKGVRRPCCWAGCPHR